MDTCRKSKIFEHFRNLRFQKKAQNQVWWVLAVIILILVTLVIWAMFTGKVGLFLQNWTLP